MSSDQPLLSRERHDESVHKALPDSVKLRLKFSWYIRMAEFFLLCVRFVDVVLGMVQIFNAYHVPLYGWFIITFSILVLDILIAASVDGYSRNRSVNSTKPVTISRSTDSSVETGESQQRRAVAGGVWDTIAAGFVSYLSYHIYWQSNANIIHALDAGPSMSKLMTPVQIQELIMVVFIVIASVRYIEKYVEEVYLTAHVTYTKRL
jgi:hypothetical protein